VIEEFGGGTASGRPLRAVQVGGPLGAYFPESNPPRLTLPASWIGRVPSERPMP
jgi:NADH:ubiquinone oxidoreductase subunit F (NADH-binding)